MKPIRAYLGAFSQGYTYDLRRNPWLWMGFLMALIVTLSPIALGAANPPVLLVQPVFFALVFGAIGTLRRDLILRSEALIRELTGLAMTDPLTGLYNRRHVIEELKNLLLRARRSEESVSVVFFDLDDFKAINSMLGHRGGDLMLKRVADALQSVLRRGETLARYGGDEFVLVVPGDLPYSRKLVDRAVEAVRERTLLSLSAGIAVAPQDGGTPEALVAAADTSLADTKRGRHEEQGIAGR